VLVLRHADAGHHADGREGRAVLLAWWLPQPGRGDDLEGSVSQDNLCGADGLRARDPVAEARAADVCLRCGKTKSAHNAVYGQPVCPFFSFRFVSKRTYDAAVRRAALEEAERRVEWIKSDEGRRWIHGKHPAATVYYWHFDAAAAAIRRLTAEGK
jgi:hypothetical protein